MRDISIESFFDELEKIADRPVWKDFLAGVEPTGTYTYRYGAADALKGPAERKKRMALAALGGGLGGAITLPILASSAVSGAKGFLQGGLRGAGRGVVSGLAAPVKGVRSLISAARSGASMTPEARRKVLLSGAGLAGAAGLAGGSAAMQYRAGEGVGKILTTPQRQLVREGAI